MSKFTLAKLTLRECLRVKSFSIRNKVTRTQERQGYIRHVGQYSTIRRAVLVLYPVFACAYSCALYKIYPRVVVTQLFRSPRWISMKTHGANAGPTRRSKCPSHANRSSRPSACRLRPLLIRHSFLTTANKFGLSIFPPSLNRTSQLGGEHMSPLTTETSVTIRLPLACIWILENPTTRSSQLESIHEGD